MDKDSKINFMYDVRTFFRRNYILRLIVKPIKSFARKYTTFKYKKSPDAAFIKSLENKYFGQRCCIVGNGPSLKIDDLEKLNCISFGSNYIYKIFKKTSWRPDFFCCVDRVVIKKIGKKLSQIPVDVKFVDYASKKMFREDNSVIALNRINRFTIHPYSPQMAMISEKPNEYLGCCYTVTAECIQLAIYMGFQEIVLIGVDHGFSTYYDIKGKLVISNNGNGNHFYEEKKVAAANAGCPFIVEQGYKLCKSLAQKKNIKIYNLSRKTELNIFEKRNFDDFF